VIELSQTILNDTRSRLQRILRGCGWTLNLRRKPSGYYAYAAKRDKAILRDQYIAPAHKVWLMETAEIKAILSCEAK
jgi:hypothetical protein